MVTASLTLHTVTRTQIYGWRDLPGVGRNYHRGRDSAFGLGRAVTAIGEGRVVEATFNSTYGNYVKIAHGPKAGQLDTSYHSLSRIAVSAGQIVKLGTVIGYAGRTAAGSTGSHLHLSLWVGGVTVDPDTYLTPGVARTVAFGAPVPVGSTTINARAVQIALAARGYTIVVDGSYGPQTTAVVKLAQKALGVVVDGVVGPQTWAVLKISEDGIWGKQTVRGLQAALGLHIDGIYGPVTKKALQKFLGTIADGAIGAVTIVALQKRLGVLPDGKLGPVTIKALQKRLNAGNL